MRSVVPVGADAPLDLIGPLGCGVQTGAGVVLNVMRPGVGSSFLGSGAVNDAERASGDGSAIKPVLLMP